MNLFYSLFLALVTLFNSITGLPHTPDPAAAAVSKPYVTQTPAPTPAPTIPIYLPARTLSFDGTDWEDMDYLHYDPGAFYEQVEVLHDLAAAGDLEGVCQLYDRLYEEFAYVDALNTIAYIHYSTDVTDEYWSEEYLYCEDVWSETGDALSYACRQILESDLGEGFAVHIGPEAAESLVEYEAMTDREAELVDREAELVNEYFDIMATADAEAVYTYLGEEWTFEKLNGFPGDNLYYDDYDGYQEVYDGLMAAVNTLVGPLYVELVSIRTEIADILGYDSYADYAYEVIYGRDYTTDEAKVFCDAVKAFSAAYYEELYYSDLWFSHEDVAPVMDEEALIAALGEHLYVFGDAFPDVWRYMTEHDLYEICDDPDAQPGGFTTELAYYRSPYLYMSLTENCRDFSTLTHEFGHFAEAYFNPIPHLLSGGGNYDLFEIHSTGMEVLFTEMYDEIFTENADTAIFITLGGLVESVLDGCIHDEFQRRIYANPGMTLEDINRLYAQILEEFGMDAQGEMDYSWMYVSHNFESPLYYISYAVSSLASLQLWEMARKDFPAAAEVYRSIVAQGAYGDGYFTVLENAGLRLFTEEGAVEDICRPAMDRMKSLENTA